MAMDFLEHQAQWLSKAFILALILVGCNTDVEIVEKWYNDGQLMERRCYKDGRRNGLHEGWWPDGSKKFEYHYHNDAYNGEVVEWYEDGQMYRRMNYKDGHEDGRQQMWKPDGRIMANYEMKNGRKYGLAGVKNCTTVWDENDSIIFKE